ncbi:MAG: prepilin-type N-terminal cleavage/methylation domain-containing protein [Candidatus Paceibacterota bacterium]
MKNVFKNILKRSRLNSLFLRNYQKNAPDAGLTLVEVLVSMGLFAILSISFVTLFTTSMNNQAAILQKQELLNQSGYVVDYMHRFLRMVTRDDSATCTLISSSNYSGNNYSSDIYFLGYDTIALDYRCMRLRLDNDKIKITKFDSASRTNGVEMDITSSTVKVNNLQFYVTGDASSDTVQPKVSIMIDMQSASLRTNPIPRILIQTTASQRNLDVP